MSDRRDDPVPGAKPSTVLALSLLAALAALPLTSPATATTGPGHVTPAGPAEATEEAGVHEVRIRVDGMSCPFCAYGLEKKLKEVAHVASLQIEIDDGLAIVRPEEGTAVDLAALEEAIRKGGFTPREMRVSATGRLTELAGEPVLELPDGIVLRLAPGDAAGSGISGADAGSVVRVEGAVGRDSPEGHTGHPYTVRVDSFAVVR